MIVHRCDRCGRESEFGEHGVTVTLYSGREKLLSIKEFGYAGLSIDLCEPCLQSFSKWFSKNLPPVEETILGRQEDLSDPHP